MTGDLARSPLVRTSINPQRAPPVALPSVGDIQTSMRHPPSTAYLLVFLAACSGGIVEEEPAPAPDITSFTADPATLAPGGGEVTLSWDVTNADAVIIDPFPGVVTGNTVTVTVSESTSFLLTAANEVGDALAVASVTVEPDIPDQPVEPITVSGQVVFVDASPAPFVPVWVHGYPPTLTNGAGNFTVQGVVPPYRVTVVHGISITAITYMGLSTPSPALVLIANGTEFSATSVAGTLSPGFPAAAGTSNRVCTHVRRGSSSSSIATEATGDYLVSAPSWRGKSDS